MSYDFKKEWIRIRETDAIPSEIISFMESVFQITEIRERVGVEKGIKFEVRSRENNHTIPHLHAQYDKHSISIAIETGIVLAGELPQKQQKIAIDWVARHKEQLMNKWNNLSISATSIMTKSLLG